MMSSYDIIQGESVVLNCTASYWSVVFTLVSDMTVILLDSDWSIRSHDLFNLPLQFSTELSSSGGIIYLKTRIFFDSSV